MDKGSKLAGDFSAKELIREVKEEIVREKALGIVDTRTDREKRQAFYDTLVRISAKIPIDALD
jgi:hypothetical protein